MLQEVCCIRELLQVVNRGSPVLYCLCHFPNHELAVPPCGVYITCMVLACLYLCIHTIFLQQIWDTAGQERFKSLRTPFYRGSDMCLLTFSIDDPPSFKNLDMWRKEFVYYADVKADFPFLVVGNKVNCYDAPSLFLIILRLYVSHYSFGRVYNSIKLLALRTELKFLIHVKFTI